MAGEAWRPEEIAGGARRLDEVDLVELGVHDPPSEHWLERPSAAPVDEVVAGDGPLVVVAGPALSGKSHTLARAARNRLGDHAVVRPDDPHTVDLAALVAGTAGPAVVWLDDAPPRLLDQITPALLVALPAGVRLFVTATEERMPTRFLDHGPRDLLRTRGIGVRLGPLRPRGDVDPLAGLRPALEEVRAALTPGMFTTPEVALLRGAVDVVRIGWPSPVTRDVLLRLTLSRGFGFVDPDAAVEPLSHRLLAGRPALAWTGTGDRLRPWTHPLAVAVADGTGVEAWRPPFDLCEFDARLSPAARHVVGRTALARGETFLASRLLRDLDPSVVPPRVALELGQVWDDEIDADPGRAWFRRAADDPSLTTRIHLGLGHLEADYMRDPVAAREHYLAVIDERGVRRSLARIAEWSGDLVEARERHLEVVERGTPGEREASVGDLARLADQAGDLEDARYWYAWERELVVDRDEVTEAWATMEMRFGEYAWVRRMLDGRDAPADSAFRLLLAAAALLDGDREAALETLGRPSDSWAFPADRAAQLLEALLRGEDTRAAAETLARDPALLHLERGPVRCLTLGVEAERADDHAEARARFREVVDDPESAPVVVGIARDRLARTAAGADGR